MCSHHCLAQLWLQSTWSHDPSTQVWIIIASCLPRSDKYAKLEHTTGSAMSSFCACPWYHEHSHNESTKNVRCITWCFIMLTLLVRRLRATIGNFDELPAMHWLNSAFLTLPCCRCVGTSSWTAVGARTGLTIKPAGQQVEPRRGYPHSALRALPASLPTQAQPCRPSSRR